MRSLLLGAAALVLATMGLGPAQAKDLEGAAPVVQQWAGAYGGIHAGLGQANRTGCFLVGLIFIAEPNEIESCDDQPTYHDMWGSYDALFSHYPTFDYAQKGGLIGLQLGYNWQASQNFLLGVEVSASATNISGELEGALGGIGTWNNLLMATAKAGITKDRWLFYVEGGVAVANAHFAGDLGCDFDMTHFGPTVGVGVGVKLSQRVSLDLKYNHIWLDEQSAGCSNLGCLFPTEVRTGGDMDVVKLGLNFHFGST